MTELIQLYATQRVARAATANWAGLERRIDDVHDFPLTPAFGNDEGHASR